ncbi:MAG: glutamate decarboxylase [Candidatus Poriferisodalaceae bacterium]|jgi:glutamate decarboxylase
MPESPHFDGIAAGVIDGIIERTTRYLTDPPEGSDPVISLASPQALVDSFAQTVGLAFGEDSCAHESADVLAAVEQVIEYSMHTSHPRFVNQNFAGPDPVSVVGDWLGAALNTTGATFEAAPVFTLMESAVLDKLGRLAGYVSTGESNGSLPVLPPGLFCAGGSMGTLLALQLARHRHQPDVTLNGSNGDRLALFVSDAGHYAASKSAALLGIGTSGVVKVATDHLGAMLPAALDAAIDDALASGQTPFAVIGTSGTTVTSAFDDLNAIADICEVRGLWLHVDGCYGGSALFSPEHAWRLRGVERSDSFVWNLHKMLGMTQQCTALLVRDPAQLAPCFATGADYLFQPDKLHGEYDSGDRTFQCARRVDVLKLWLTWKTRGDEGFAARLDHAFAMAEHTRQRIADSDGAFVSVVSGSFTSVVFAWVPPHLRPMTAALGTGPTGDVNLAGLSEPVRAELHALPPKIKAQMQANGTGMIGYQPIHGLNTFRMICMSPTLKATDVDVLLEAIEVAVV